MEDRVREVVAEHGRLAVDVTTLSDDDDLYRAGFPEHLLRRQTFESVSAICAGLAELVPSNA